MLRRGEREAEAEEERADGEPELLMYERDDPESSTELSSTSGPSAVERPSEPSRSLSLLMLLFFFWLSAGTGLWLLLLLPLFLPTERHAPPPLPSLVPASSPSSSPLLFPREGGAVCEVRDRSVVAGRPKSRKVLDDHHFPMKPSKHIPECVSPWYVKRGNHPPKLKRLAWSSFCRRSYFVAAIVRSTSELPATVTNCNIPLSRAT